MVLNKYKIPIFVFIIFTYMFIVNFLTPLFADDYSYSFLFDDSKRVENFLDVIKSQFTHYFSWGGRTVAHTIGQTLLMSNKFFIAVLNSCMFIFLIFLIYFHSQGKDFKMNFRSILLILFFIWVSIPTFAETTIWLIGSVNYLWTTVIILSFLLPYRYNLTNSNFIKDNTQAKLIMFFLGIIAGWTNENTALVMLMLTFISIFYCIRFNLYKRWMLTGFFGGIIGFCLMIFAPGNQVRSKIINELEDYSFILYHIKLPLLSTFKIMAFQLPVWIAILLFTTVLYLQAKKKGYSIGDIIKLHNSKLVFSAILIFASLINNLIMFASPYFPLRAGFGSSIFLIIGATSLFNIPMISSVFTRMKALQSVVALLLLFSMSNVLIKYTKIYQEDKYRTELIEQSKENNQYLLKVPSYSMNYKNLIDSHLNHVFISDIGSDPNVWPNNDYARFFGLKGISVMEKNN